ncbi:MAG: sigma 54-interacting transcriptional regulator [Desulfovibrionaceae bacterium]|nr:sigma 54-interacting transcriptional regulator [Desulfovibrionaceae bacterium]
MSKRDFRFAFVSNSQIIAQRVLEYATACGMCMEIHLATMESAVPVARKLLDEGVDVILGGGGTGKLMRQCLHRPVVTIERSHLDLLRALMDARKITEHIAITYYDIIPEGLDMLAELLHVRLQPISFTTTQDLITGITHAIAHGAGCIVGGGICVEIAKAQGSPGVVCLPGRENLQRAMEEALNIAEGLRQERTRTGGTGFVARHTLKDILGESAIMQELRRKAAIFASSEAAVFIHGETGTGKELLAHAVHCASTRRHKPFVAINCAAMPEHLLESELFGYEEGAFTGAKRGGKDGLFLLAQGGTIFLDEVGDISPALQIRLLRVLEAREILRVGGNTLIPIDVRIISASLKNLAAEVRQGNFRSDLYYRLATLRLQCPALRDRLEDMAVLCAHLLHRLGAKHIKLPPQALRIVLRYRWPGNIRELEALLRRYVLLLEEKDMDAGLFTYLFDEMVKESPLAEQKKQSASPLQVEELTEGCSHLHYDNTALQKTSDPTALFPSLKERTRAFEAACIQQTLTRTHGDKLKAAALLKIGANTLWRKLKYIEE